MAGPSIRWQWTNGSLRVWQQAARQARGRLLGAVRKSVAQVTRRAKINVRQKLNTTGTSTGALSGSIGYDVDGSRLAGHVGTAMIYARIHEFGGVIRPVRAPMLRFTLPDGTFVRTKRVTIPARPYLTPALEESMPEIEGFFRDAVSGPFGGEG